VFIGEQAGYTNVSGNANVFLGFQAGYYETGSNKLFIDNQKRADEADARAKALIYGVFAPEVANQSLTVNANTDFSAGFTTLNYGTSAPSLTTNGQLAVAYVGSAARLYFQANGATYYIDKTGGFGIPAQETVDPLSGDKMKIGDIVVGMINQNLGDEKTPEESSLHGIWVKWDSVKKQLLQEIREAGAILPEGDWGTASSLDSSEKIKNVDTTTMLEKVVNALKSLGISVKDGVAHIKELTVKKLTAETTRTERLEMIDSVTGEIYCTWIENGIWQKAKGDCASVKIITPAIKEEQLTPPEEKIKDEESEKEESETEEPEEVHKSEEDKSDEEPGDSDELIQEATSGLLNGIRESVRQLFAGKFSKNIFWDIRNKIRAEFINGIHELNNSIKISLEKTIPVLIESQFNYIKGILKIK